VTSVSAHDWRLASAVPGNWTGLFLAHDDQTEAARLLVQAAADLLKETKP